MAADINALRKDAADAYEAYAQAMAKVDEALAAGEPEVETPPAPEPPAAPEA